MRRCARVPRITAGNGLVRHHFQRVEERVVRFIDVHVDITPVFFREIEPFSDLRPAVVGTGLVGRHAAQYVGAHLQRCLQQRCALRALDNTLLWESDDPGCP